MRNRFDEQLHTLNHELLEMGALIERAIRSATDALVKQDVEAALQAINICRYSVGIGHNSNMGRLG